MDAASPWGVLNIAMPCDIFHSFEWVMRIKRCARLRQAAAFSQRQSSVAAQLPKP
ncbi:MAG TPA: hypothetical protein VHO90_15675 [Bacteroidales bacterium]|nr:hypothetical protein [Bacteroidales bacterium]